MVEESGATSGVPPTQQSSSSSRSREQDAIYQKGKVVARVAEAEVDLEGKKVRFDEIYDSDHLIIPDECEFRNYSIMIQRVAFASKVDKQSGRPGRVLRGCVADILGYREQ